MFSANLLNECPRKKVKRIFARSQRAVILFTVCKVELVGRVGHISRCTINVTENSNPMQTWLAGTRFFLKQRKQPKEPLTNIFLCKAKNPSPNF
jgi:hypothetical protein